MKQSNKKKIKIKDKEETQEEKILEKKIVTRFRARESQRDKTTKLMQEKQKSTKQTQPRKGRVKKEERWRGEKDEGVQVG